MQFALDLANFSPDLAAHLFHPRMGLYLSDSWALGRIELKNVDDEALQFLAEVAAQLVIAKSNLFPHLLYTFTRKRSKTMKQFVKKDSKSPHINAVVVLLLKDHLRSHVLISAAKGLAFHLDVVSRPAKITNLDIQSMIK